MLDGRASSSRPHGRVGLRVGSRFAGPRDQIETTSIPASRFNGEQLKCAPSSRRRRTAHFEVGFEWRNDFPVRKRRERRRLSTRGGGVREPAVCRLRSAADRSHRADHRHIILDRVYQRFDFDGVFARQVEALAKAGDILIGISTSGRSRNVVRAAESAKRKAFQLSC